MYRLECDKFKHPRGIPTGPDGGIYVTDVTAHCLFKFNKEGQLLKTIVANWWRKKVGTNYSLVILSIPLIALQVTKVSCTDVTDI